MEFKFDYQAAVQQLKDMLAIDIMASFAPDEKTKKSVYEIMGVFVKNGGPGRDCYENSIRAWRYV